ncbi:MAG TPA: prolyl oligopeptidase family serine peptidase [Kofleriaceae bacterium]|nr:prolyl oligopeptidase family serine peptidase [Kofleriaceae bacterium]
MIAIRFGAVVLIACSSPAVAPRAAPPASPAPPAEPAGPAPAAPAAPGAAGAAPQVVAPTELTAEDRKRDAAREPLATSVVDAFPNWGGLFSTLVARWSPDGKRLLFGSLRDGLPEIYAADAARPDSAPLLLSPGQERALSGQYTQDGTAVLYLRDTGADENYAIWRVGLDGKNPVNLTPGPALHREQPLLPRKQPRMMLYSAARTAAPDTALYQQDLAGGEPRQVYTQPLPGGGADVTPDGSRVLFVEFHSEADVVTREVDVATGAAHRVYPPEGAHAGLYGVAYASDGKRVFVTTDEGERVVLLAIDPATGKELARYRDAVPTAQLTALPSPAGDVLALGIDAGNHGELRILDARKLTVIRTVKVPLGQIVLGAFRDDGRAFSVMISLPDQPPDVFAVETRTGKVTALRADPRPGLAQLPALDVSVQSARAFDGLTIPINVYLPRRGAAARLPAIAMFHGGPSSSYAVRWSPFVRFFTALGYAVIEPNVRGSTGFGRAYEQADNREKRADWLSDLKTVNTWVKAQPWCDPERVIVFGGSYGGYTTLMAMTRQPEAWRAGADLFGPADLRQFLLTTDAAIRSAFVAEFGDVDRDVKLLEEFSPMRDVDRIVRPLFVYAGQNDPRVPRSESDTIVKALRSRKIPVEYMVAASEGHSVDRRETKIELMTRLARFFEDALR